MRLIDVDRMRTFMALVGPGSSVRDTLMWLAQHVNERFELAVERAVERMLKPRDPKED